MRKTQTLVLCALVTGCTSTGGEGPSTSGPGGGKADDGSSVALECAQARDGEGSLTITDRGEASDVPSLAALEDGIVHEGITVHEYRVKGSYTRDGEASELDAAYFGRLFEPDGEIFTHDDKAWTFWNRTEADGYNAGLTVRYAPGSDQGVVFQCMGDLPARDDVLPTYTASTFTCHTTTREAGGATATIGFTVRDLANAATIDLVWPAGDEEASAISVTPETSRTRTLMSGIANGYVELLDDRMRIWTDDDGFEFGTVILFADSEYKRGYVRIESGLGDPGFYSELYCEIEDTTSR